MSFAGPFATEEDFLTAYYGNWGDNGEAEAAADALVDSGQVLMPDEAGEYEYEEPDDAGNGMDRAEEAWRFDMELGFSKLANSLGRPLTSAEVESIVEDNRGLEHTQFPDFVEKYGEGLGRRTEADPESRQDYMAEVMDDINNGRDVERDADGRPRYLEEPDSDTWGEGDAGVEAVEAAAEPVE